MNLLSQISEKDFENMKLQVSDIKSYLLYNAKSMGYFIQFNSFEMNLTGIITLLAWIKLSKFVNFTAGLTQMTATLCKSFMYLSSYLIVYMVIFISHAAILSRFFGQINEEFKTFVISLFTLLRMLLGHVNFSFLHSNNYPLYKLIFFPTSFLCS